MFQLLSWVIFGAIVGSLAKWFDGGEVEGGFAATLAIGIAGSFVGGLISYMLNAGTTVYHPAGLVLSILGGVAFLAAWRWYGSQAK